MRQFGREIESAFPPELYDVPNTADGKGGGGGYFEPYLCFALSISSNDMDIPSIHLVDDKHTLDINFIERA